MRKYYIGDLVPYDGLFWKVVGASFQNEVRMLVLKHIPREGEEDLGSKLVPDSRLEPEGTRDAPN